LSTGHILGTDDLGRDTLSRLIFASRVALRACSLAVTVGVLLGVTPGLFAGYLGGWIDFLIMRTTEILQSFPPLILAIAFVFVRASLAAGSALIIEAGLSFLGLGVQAPDASWGSMLGRGYQFLSLQPWLIVFPGLLIGCTALAFNLVGDGLQDSLGRDSGGGR